MEVDNGPINTVTFTELESVPLRRVRKVNWTKIIELLDSKPGEWALIGEFDQSLATHIRKYRYKYIDPSLYQVTCSKSGEMQKNRGNLYMRRIENS